MKSTEDAHTSCLINIHEVILHKKKGKHRVRQFLKFCTSPRASLTQIYVYYIHQLQLDLEVTIEMIWNSDEEAFHLVEFANLNLICSRL